MAHTVKITDLHYTMEPITVEADEIAERLQPWFPEASPDVRSAVNQLEAAVRADRHEQHGLAQYLGLSVEQA